MLLLSKLLLVEQYLLVLLLPLHFHVLMELLLLELLLQSLQFLLLLLQLLTLLVELLLRYLIAVGVSMEKPGKQASQNQKSDFDHGCLHFVLGRSRSSGWLPYKFEPGRTLWFPHEGPGGHYVLHHGSTGWMRHNGEHQYPIK